MRSLPVVLVLGALAFAGAAEPGEAGRAKRPRLELRASPRMAFPPASVLVVAELKGGDDHEDYYCPGLEWDFGDGHRSAQESDCEPFGGGTALERRYSVRHAFRSAGRYNVTLTLRRASRTVAVAQVPVVVHGPSFGEEN